MSGRKYPGDILHPQNISLARLSRIFIPATITTTKTDWHRLLQLVGTPKTMRNKLQGAHNSAVRVSQRYTVIWPRLVVGLSFCAALAWLYDIWMSAGKSSGLIARQCLTYSLDSVYGLSVIISHYQSVVPRYRLQHVRPTGFFCCWPVCRELPTGPSPRFGHQGSFRRSLKTWLFSKY